MVDITLPPTPPHPNRPLKSFDNGNISYSAVDTRIGRPNQWTASRQRKLARLYLYTSLPTKDIRQALKDRDSDWFPGKESTSKTVNSLLDNDPRWLRPKSRKEQDARMLGLSAGRDLRKQWRNPAGKQPDTSDFPKDNSQIANDHGTEYHISCPITVGREFATDDTSRDSLLAKSSESEYDDLVLNSRGAGWDNIECSAGEGDFLDACRGTASMLSSSPLDFEQIITTSTQDAAPQKLDDGESLLSTELSISSLKNRLSSYSTLNLRAVAALLKAHSVSDTSNSNSSFAKSVTPTYHSSTTSGDRSFAEQLTIRPASSHHLPRPLSRVEKVVLPSSLLVLDQHIQEQGICLPGLKTHDAGICWCLDGLKDQLWVHQDGLTNVMTKDPPESLAHLSLEFRDIFGNKVLHMLAARGAEMPVIIEALEWGADGNAQNHAGQTFLHLLPPEFLRMLARHPLTMVSVLQHLTRLNVGFHHRDVFGRNFLHLLIRQASKSNLQSLSAHIILREFNNLLPCSDAFGLDSGIPSSIKWPLQDGTAQTHSHTRIGPSGFNRIPYSIAHHLQDTSSVICLETESGSLARASTQCVPPVWDHQNYLIYTHARMLETAWIAFDVPSIQDSQGRNGLQCLAEASLNLHMQAHGTRLWNLKKRKRGHCEPMLLSPRLKLRFELAQRMIHVGIDPNNYDSQGSTVLMAFVVHLVDGEDDKLLTDMLNFLIDSGANLHRRNRKGETALHIAVRLGRKVATLVLLNKGANVHARTCDEKGVLALGKWHYLKARDDTPLYASIIACMALCMKFGAVSAPTWVQEWSTEPGPI
ncbi:hypothetical protein BKA65DRAFT_553069 [Rhexocercosporidium sp. MPI-PUGE-AT-0058]|nr:hypothetical protein BKA65DRAFT_553069 [Rhexocercosporidium sp. MPI-PUGE-AT-0058]